MNARRSWERLRLYFGGRRVVLEKEGWEALERSEEVEKKGSSEGALLASGALSTRESAESRGMKGIVV